MSTLATLRDEAVFLCQELQSIPDFSETMVDHWINRGYHHFCRETKILQKTFSITTVANQESYTLDDDVIGIDEVRYVEESNEYGYLLAPIAGGHMGLPREHSFGTPTSYWVRYPQDRGAVEIGTFPIISVSSETLEVSGYHQPTSDLSADGDIPEFQEQWHHALTYYAVWWLHMAYAHKSSAIRGKGIQFEAMYREIVELAKHRVMTGLHSETKTVDVYR